MFVHVYVHPNPVPISPGEAYEVCNLNLFHNSNRDQLLIREQKSASARIRPSAREADRASLQESDRTSDRETDRASLT